MNGTTALRRSVGGGGAGSQEPPPVATLVVYKDDAGYGMKVSGDNPVYVQSVKEGGAAARAGLHAGDKIIKVNGVNVMQSTHTEVVGLIKSSTQVVLTVQQKPAGPGLQVGSPAGQQQQQQQQQQRPASLSAGSTMVSPTQPASSLHRASTAPAGGAPPSCNARITGPQPVDHEKKRQMDAQRVHTFQLMLEKEQSYVDKLRSDLAKSGAGAGSTSSMAALHGELAGAERRVRTLQDQLATITASDQLCSLVTNTSTPPGNYSGSPGGNVDGGGGGDAPPPLPSRKSLSMQNLSPPPLPPRPQPTSNTNNILHSELDRHLLTHLTPPTTSYGIPNSLSQGVNFGSSGSLNKHQRTKSSPEQLSTTMISPSEASRRLIASESLNDLSPPRHSGIDLDDPVHVTPPGTPPPPYPQPSPASETSSSAINDSLGDSFVNISPIRQPPNEGIPGLPPIQKPIMSMEDDDMSDQEVGQLGDHGPFKSLSRLWEHHAHLSVFINYVLSNSDPSSLLFYLVTDLYKEGNAKEMRKWAYEIHSSFLVPGAPLRLNNVDENVAREIDDVLLKEYDKEEILRKIFWKARTRAKEELNEQLADFQQKRTAGLGTLFGPKEEQLDECVNDKMHEARIMETYILPKMQPYLDALEADQVDLRKFTTAAGLATILTKIFQVRPISLEQVPTFVAKDKSNIKARLTGKTRKMTVQGHHFVAHQYFTVTFCNHCQLIIGGIGPQGYQCSDCSLSVHRACVRAVEETCPGPLIRKERANVRISRIMERIRPERKPPSSHHHHHSQNHMHPVDRVKRAEEEAGVVADGENGEASAPEKRSRDKVAKSKRRQSTTKPKSLNARTFHGTAKGSLVIKVWETLVAVRRSRGSCNDIAKSAELVVHLDEIGPLALCPVEPALSDLPSAPCTVENARKLITPGVDLWIEEKDIFTQELPSTGEHRGSGTSGNARSSCERGRISAYGDYPDSMDNPSSREDISEMVQQNISSKPKTSNINRSESYKERIHHKRQVREKRKTSDPNLSKTKAGFSDCEAAGTFPGNSAGSSSNSSLSTRSLDSPSTSLEQVHPANAGANASTSWDSDVDVEADPPEWSQGVAEEVLSRLSNSEKKRQEVINELFHTERSHVRALKVLSYVFHRPLLESQVLPLDQVQLLFSNLDEMVTIHSRFNQAMKRKKKENPCVGDVGELLLEMFDGEEGEAFERSASTYCAKQQVALDALRDRRRKDPKLNAFLNEVEANPLCRRLQLKDHILTGMLRLTKYPLLFENLAKYTPEDNERERAAVLRSLERSKEILSVVNQAVREAEDCQRLAEIQRSIDRSAFDKFDHPSVQEFRSIDITKRRLLFEGPLQWRIVNRPKLVDLHVVLLDDAIFLLHRQDDRYLLKFINTNQVNSVLSPIVRVSTVLVRNNAVDKNSLYLVNTSQNGAQIYDLVAASQAERELWCRHISEAADAYYKARDREGRRPTPPTVIAEDSASAAAAAAAAAAAEPPPEQPAAASTEVVTPKSTEEQTEGKDDDAATDAKPEDENEEHREPAPPETTKHDEEPAQFHGRHSPVPGSVEPMRMVTCTQCSLIDPIEVHTEVQPVHVAEPVLTPIECLRRKDEVIKRALVEKQSLVADILNIPKEDFEHVADMASEPSGLEKEPAELILAAISQANHLVGMLNSTLTVTETESVLASKGTASPSTAGCEATGCPIPRSHGHPYQPVIPVVALQPICHSLTSQLSQLLEIVKEREDERERLRKELRRNRERLHALDADAQRREEPNVPSQATIHTQTESVTEEISPTEIATEKINKNEYAEAYGDRERSSEEGQRRDAKGGVESEVMGDSVG